MVDQFAQSSGSSELLDRAFSALGDPTRRALLARLTTGAATVGDLAEPFEISLAAVSKHLKVLERAGLIRREVQGRHHYCHLDPAPLGAAAQWLEACRRFWEQRLDSLEWFLIDGREKGEQP